MAVSNNLRYFILGGGSNIVFADEGYNGLIIRDTCRDVIINGDVITAQSGVPLNELVDMAIANSLGGLEFAAGIPGNVGGAIYGNAGAFGGCIADVLVSAVIYNPQDGIRIVDGSFFKFTYRHSRLKDEPMLILSASFQLKPSEKAEIADKANEYRQLRQTKHPDYRKLGCAGSVFKNIKEPQLLPAGKLLEEAGVRGLKIGGAEVYEKHCNIIVNNGSAKAADVKKLASIMRQRVIEKFNIPLEYEILFIDP